ncbi:MAG TPA: RNA polymerase sigma factor [Dehalococcoidia bacterium]|nr:RNA polymerase sigma factor [Dehalococcoidia bacterium]
MIGQHLAIPHCRECCFDEAQEGQEQAESISTGYPEEIQLVSGQDGPEKLAINSELRERLEGGLDRLAPNLKSAVILRDLQGMNNQEAADVLSVSVSSLKARLRRGRVQLREYIRGYLEDQTNKEY